MEILSRDVDILRYEPSLFDELFFPWQVLCCGQSGAISGTSFEVSGEDFLSAGVSAGGVVYLESAGSQVRGCFEIVSVDSAGRMTVSVVRPDDDSGSIGPGDAVDVAYRVSTYAPQGREVMLSLTNYFGLRPGLSNSVFGVEDFVDAGVLRQASVYAVISGIYASLAGRADAEEGYWKKSLHYSRLFEQARERCRLPLDMGGDGVTDRTVLGGSARLYRD